VSDQHIHRHRVRPTYTQSAQTLSYYHVHRLHRLHTSCETTACTDCTDLERLPMAQNLWDYHVKTVHRPFETNYYIQTVHRLPNTSRLVLRHTYQDIFWEYVLRLLGDILSVFHSLSLSLSLSLSFSLSIAFSLSRARARAHFLSAIPLPVSPSLLILRHLSDLFFQINRFTFLLV